MLKCPRHVKLGYVFAEAMWFIYAADSGLMGMYAVHCAMICVGLFALYLKPRIGDLRLQIMLRKSV
jgi:hypothetical protein